MPNFLKVLGIRTCILLIFTLNSSMHVYSQESRHDRELDEAIVNVENAQYEIAIPVLKKYAEIREIDDYKKLETLEDIYESRLLEETLKKGKFYSLEEVARRVKVEL